MNASFYTLPPSLQAAANQFFIGDIGAREASGGLPVDDTTRVPVARVCGPSLSTIQARLNELRVQEATAWFWHELTEGTPLHAEHVRRLAAVQELIQLWERKQKFS